MGALPGTGQTMAGVKNRRFGRLRRVSVILSLALTSCGPSVLEPTGTIGKAERSILIDSVGIMLAIVLPTIALALAFAWWYRQSNGRAKRLPEFVYSGRIELVVWAIPLMTIMLLGGVTWIGAHELDPAHPIASKQKPLEIQGVSLDWKWLFIYPDQRVASVNELTIPTDTPIHFSLTSGSVMNAFFVPKLGSMIYTMDGMISRLNLMAEQPGDYWGESSHYSGDGFSDMHFTVHAVPADQFAAWVKKTQASGPKLDAGSYAELAKQTRHVVPFTYANADPALFVSVASEHIPQGPGPVESGAKRATVSPEGQN
jgi:cytochrome o ubiquinol oxidase subunit 2